MLLLALALVLQQADPEPSTPQASVRSSSFSGGIGPDAGFWISRLHGQVRADGDTATGTTIRLRDDLHLPAERGIPIYGGGSVYIPVSHARNPDEILLSAEYWARQWKSATVLDENEQFGNATYAKGTRVGSAFRLDSFDLALAYRAQDDDGYLRGGASLLLHATGGKLKLSRAGTTEQETFGDLLWGGGLFGELRPQRFFLIGLSVKGYTNFGQDPGTGMADLRAFAGVDWKFLRFEGGLRYMPYAEAGTTDKKMSFDLYGPYVSLSLVWRF